MELWIGMSERQTCITYVSMSKSGSKEMQVIHFDQDVQVCGTLKNFYLNSFGMTLPFLIFFGCGLCFFSFFLFPSFFLMLSFEHGYLFFFSLFCIAHILLCNDNLESHDT